MIVRCHRRRLHGLPAGSSRLTSRFDMNIDGVVDFKDFVALADEWLDELLWPQP